MEDPLPANLYSAWYQTNRSLSDPTKYVQIENRVLGLARLRQVRVMSNSCVIPDDFKQEIIKKIDSFVERHNAKYKTDMGHLFTHIKHELTKPHCKKSAIQFLEISAKLDRIRGEFIFDVIPEMEILREMYPGKYVV